MGDIDRKLIAVALVSGAVMFAAGIVAGLLLARLFMIPLSTYSTGYTTEPMPWPVEPAMPSYPGSVGSFDECVAAGYPVMESYPRQCRGQDGSVYVEETYTKPGGGAPRPDSCLDLCGDGRCEEIACEALGCPCPESPNTCPADCESSNILAASQ